MRFLIDRGIVNHKVIEFTCPKCGHKERDVAEIVRGKARAFCSRCQSDVEVKDFTELQPKRN